MDKRILFFDIDGTLLNSKAEVPISAVKALSALRENGHLRFLCTGRTKCMIPEVVRNLSFDGYVMGGGTEVEYQGERLYYKELSLEIIQKVIPILKKYGFVYIFEGSSYIYYEKADENEERAYFSSFVKSFGKLALVIAEYEKMHASKITLVPPTGFSKESAKAFQFEINKEFHVIIHEPAHNDILTDGLIELVPKEINKATGIEHVIQSLHINKDKTIGIGDSNNDLEMLSYVEMAVCMGNGTERAKELADLVTTHIDEDGIWNSMKKLELI